VSQRSTPLRDLLEPSLMRDRSRKVLELGLGMELGLVGLRGFGLARP
jgi:hypothetical protein